VTSGELHVKALRFKKLPPEHVVRRSKILFQLEDGRSVSRQLSSNSSDERAIAVVIQLSDRPAVLWLNRAFASAEWTLADRFRNGDNSLTKLFVDRVHDHFMDVLQIPT
jgi:hypothetical protein